MKIKAKGEFLLGQGESGVAGDVEFDLERSSQSEVDCGAVIPSVHLDEVTSAIQDWLSRYAEIGIFLKARITHVGVDPHRTMDHARAVSLAFYEALPQLKIDPPQIFAPPPQVFGITLAVEDIKKSLNFYIDFGISFNEDNQLNYTRYIYDNDGFLFILKQANSPREVTINVTLKFFIDEIDGYVSDIEEAGLVIIKSPWDSSEGRHLTFENFEGNTVELTCKK